MAKARAKAKPTKSANKPAAKKPAKKPAAKKPAVKRPAVKKPAAKKPAAKKPAAEKPAPTITARVTPPPPVATTPVAPTATMVELLGQILAAPDDRSLRGVYADLLIDAGDPRGTFISQQCALSQLDPLDERYAPMLASTHRLQARHARAWLGDPDPPPPGSRVPIDRLWNARFTDGFLRSVAMAPQDIATRWPELRSREPIEGVELLVDEGLWEAERDLSEPREFRVLEVSPDGWFAANSVANVLAWGMPLLRSLDLSGCDLGIAGARMLANLETDLPSYFSDHVAPPPFAPGQLRELAVENSQVGDEGARTLFAAEHLSELVALDLRRCRIGDPGTLEALRDAPAMRSLVRLALAGNNALGEHLGILASWEALPRLVAFGVPQSTPPAAMQTLFPQPSPALRTLDLASAKQLGPWPGLVELAEAFSRLDIGTTSMGDERWHALVVAPSTRRLVHLAANGCSLSDAAIEALASSPLDRLVTLDLSSNKLTDDGLRTLAAWPGLQHVTHLRIGNNRKVTAAGLDALAASPHFVPAELDVGKLGDAGAIARLRERFGDVVLSRA